MRRLTACIGLLVLVLAACGDDGGGAAGPPDTETTGTPTNGTEDGDGGGTTDDTETEEDEKADPEPYVEALIGELEDTGVVADDEARCISTAIVDAIGADQLEEEGVTPDELTDAEDFDELGLDIDDEATDRMADRLQDCDLSSFVVAALSTDEVGAVTASHISCISAAIDNKDFASALTAFLIDQEEGPLADAVVAGMAACPGFITDAIVGALEEDQGAPVSPDGRACIAAEVERDPELAAESLAPGADGQDLGDRLLFACGELLQGSTTTTGVGSG